MSAAFPIILFNNHIDVYGVASATSEASGSPVENIHDWRHHTTWTPTSTASQDIEVDLGAAGTTTNYFAIAGHDLGTQTASATIYSDDNAGFSSPTTLGTKSFTSNDPFALSLTSSTERYLRIRLTGMDAVPSIGVMFLGDSLVMERVPTSPYDIHRQVGFTEKFNTKNGSFLGTSTRYYDRRIRANFKWLTTTWVEANLLEFLETHYFEKPFFFLPDTQNYATRCYLLRGPDNGSVILPEQKNYMHWEMNASGKRLSRFV